MSVSIEINKDSGIIASIPLPEQFGNIFFIMKVENGKGQFISARNTNYIGGFGVGPKGGSWAIEAGPRYRPKPKLRRHFGP